MAFLPESSSRGTLGIQPLQLLPISICNIYWKNLTLRQCLSWSSWDICRSLHEWDAPCCSCQSRNLEDVWARTCAVPATRIRWKTWSHELVDACPKNFGFLEERIPYGGHWINPDLAICNWCKAYSEIVEKSTAHCGSWTRNLSVKRRFAITTAIVDLYNCHHMITY